ncbi:GlpM family protein [Photobacterium toruni]|uniref:Inner membrane protein YdgC n=1 Tax=Photobacterium toruni TaxID=1935446 RepID=A0A1T4UPP8_9GAMM|nr:GlpM family protein [Photobacterium toruni]MEC6814280.1 GlpM family protein [Photobacterium toruni]SKA54687.1 Inner membrane protein YdgC [Photobacterium toruni]
MVTLFFKCLLGAAAVLLIALLSKSKSFYIAGLVPLFPTFALIAHYIVGAERSMEDLRMTALFGLCSLVPYAGYLVAVYILSYYYNLTTTLSLATVVWLGCAGLLLLGWTRWSSLLIANSL